MKRLFWAVAILVVGVSAAAGAVSVVDQMSDNAVRAEAEVMRDQVREARWELNECLDDLDRAERAFREHERTTNFLRDRVEDYEAMDERGVPSDQYDEYLETFDRYNESLPEWERLGTSVQEQSAICRELAEEHNARADALVEFLVNEGLWDESWSPGDRAPAVGEESWDEEPNAGTGGESP
jgi:hypothetical protein